MECNASRVDNEYILLFSETWPFSADVFTLHSANLISAIWHGRQGDWSWFLRLRLRTHSALRDLCWGPESEDIEEQYMRHNYRKQKDLIVEIDGKSWLCFSTWSFAGSLSLKLKVVWVVNGLYAASLCNWLIEAGLPLQNLKKDT